MTKTRFSIGSRQVDGPTFLLGCLAFIALTICLILLGGAAFAFIVNNWVTPILGLGIPVLSWQEGVVLVVAFRLLFILTASTTRTVSF